MPAGFADVARGSIGKTNGKQGPSWFFRLDLDPAPSGKRRQTTKRGFPTKRAAQTALSEALHALQTGSHVTPTRYTVGELLDRWLQDYILPNRRRTTYDAYESCVRIWLKPTFGGIPLTRLSPPSIQAWQAEQQAAGVPGKSIGARRAALSSALQQAVYWGLLASNPVSRVRGAPAEAAERPVLSPEQLAALLAAVRTTDLEPPILMTLLLGLRRGEIMGLKWEDLDLTAGTLAVRRGLVRIKGGALQFQPPKSRRSKRPLPLGPLLTEALTRHRGRQAAERLRLGPLWQDCGMVFADACGKPRNPAWLTREYGKLAKKLDLPGTFHCLRHLHTSLLLGEGITPKVLQARLGHSSISVTMDIYAHLLPGQQEAATEAAERVIRRAMGEGA